MTDKSLKVLCYANDTTPTAESEEQHLLFSMKRASEKYNMAISTEKTQSIMISKKSV